ncbi:hypothetical protein [Phocaeicola coprocola]|uniref:hypothetical protein n=1 Tax=Phocaeicola coprocola TaxID=310298 RepID=UPI003AEF896A
MKKIFLVILPALLFVACKSEPVKTETRIIALFEEFKDEVKRKIDLFSKEAKRLGIKQQLKLQ